MKIVDMKLIVSIMFHNLKFNLHLFINAMDLEDAMNQFDMCQFEHRKYWKVFLETGHQPS